MGNLLKKVAKKVALALRVAKRGFIFNFPHTAIYLFSTSFWVSLFYCRRDFWAKLPCAFDFYHFKKVSPNSKKSKVRKAICCSQIFRMQLRAIFNWIFYRRGGGESETKNSLCFKLILTG